MVYPYCSWYYQLVGSCSSPDFTTSLARIVAPRSWWYSSAVLLQTCAIVGEQNLHVKVGDSHAVIGPLNPLSASFSSSSSFFFVQQKGPQRVMWLESMDNCNAPNPWTNRQTPPGIPTLTVRCQDDRRISTRPPRKNDLVEFLCDEYPSFLQIYIYIYSKGRNGPCDMIIIWEDFQCDLHIFKSLKPQTTQLFQHLSNEKKLVV